MWSGWWVWALLGLCAADQFREQARRIMSDTPAVDGHNDLPWQLLKRFNNQLLAAGANLSSLEGTHTSIPKLRAGFVGGQFWSAYTPCDTQNKDSVKRTLEQIDVIHRMCQLYPETFACITSSSGFGEAWAAHKVASLVGVEGGHSIDSSLAVLRALYHLGMRYLTLTHSCNTPWADNWLVDTGADEAQSKGLSPFGKRVVKELNRLGVMVDLAHVSMATMRAVLELSKAPVIFSHSSAYAICPNRRNVPDDVLELVVSAPAAPPRPPTAPRPSKPRPRPQGLGPNQPHPRPLSQQKQNRGLVMVNFYNDYVSCQKEANLSQVADHLDHIKKVAGAEAVGLGGDFDGVTRLPAGLEDVSKYPDLVAELLRRGWSEQDVKGALANNLVRVFMEVEKASNHAAAPEEEPIALDQLEASCRTLYGYSRAPLLQPLLGALLTTTAPLLLSLHLL
ncbi:Dipeptidase 1 [Galemys pyrenaicus]|uniref:Dipeptidase n=1 Tax=Galemys pyrenaicus TaxID=202257 RepID=A0A8J6DH79_GALPY|nr:Dipeptidase 1 [Galemys pyrenaicus]